MIIENTVIILGAGASKVYGFPLGPELRDLVLQKQNIIDNALVDWKEYSLSTTEFLEFIKDMAKSGFPSVDAYLENRSKWMQIGKKAIALDILFKEKKSLEKLFPPKQPKDHWYETLWTKLYAPTWDKFISNPIHIITFNYDRSLEHYLTNVICNHYNLKPEEVSSNLPILHVHGSLGKYNFKTYGKEFPHTIRQAARSIKIVHESNINEPLFIKARKLLQNASRILFIGFGYHYENMKKLGFIPGAEERAYKANFIIGTNKGISPSLWNNICINFHFNRGFLIKGGKGMIKEYISDNLY